VACCRPPPPVNALPVGAVLAAEVDAQSFGCVGEAEATYGWGLLLLLLLFLLLLLGVVVVEGDHCALDGVSQRRHFDFLHITIRGA